LVNRLGKEDYQVWLDEHDLIVGDQLVGQISQALAVSRVVLIVVSSASVRSKWLKFELNKAIERMIEGQCRVIPIIREKVELPPEVKGLLYADFSDSFKYGMKSVLIALEHEANRASFEPSFLAQVEAELEKVFGLCGVHATMTKDKGKIHKVLFFPLQPKNKLDLEVLYEIISADVKPPKALTSHWWDEYYSTNKDVLDNHFFLLITERPVAFQVEECHQHTSKILLKTGGYSPNYGYIHTVIIDLSESHDEESRINLLTKAKQILIKFANGLEMTK
ncbi:MAG: toll/interleukin-1 receptor domain-containing protein, partial [Nitrospira sp.]|nr:toll/interleukin-1 receptor domain-containing protein [Nitrospira sp.]